MAITLTYDDAFALGLGKLVSNLLQIEFALRVALHVQEPESDRLPRDALRNAKPGDQFGENFLTNWDSLDKLIKAYNLRERDRGGTEIDIALKDIRDALAHGRLTAPTLGKENRLIRFALPISGQVSVERVDIIDMPWLDKQIKFTSKIGRLVFARVEELSKTQRIPPR
jgi:hypothetical protein